MRDCLGREIKQGDLVIGMIVSRDSDGIRFGVATDKSIQWARIYKDKVSLGKVSVPSNVYLVETPCEKELIIKDKLIKEVARYKEKELKEKARIKSLKAIPYKELEIGASYIDANNYEYVYLGYGNLKSITRYGTDEDETGFIYLCNPNIRADGVWEWFPVYKVLKSRKKLVSKIDDITEYKFTDEFTLRCSYHVHRTIKIKLEGRV